MNFNQENILSVVDISLGHFIITQVTPSEKLTYFEDVKIISDFLKTKYFIWNYKLNPKGQTFDLEDENGNNIHFQNEKFFGFYKTEMLDFADFKRIDNASFKSSVENQILNETNSEFLEKCWEIIPNVSISDSIIYSIQPPESKIPTIVREWPIYNYFYAYVIVDRENNVINLIEFGFD